MTRPLRRFHSPAPIPSGTGASMELPEGESAHLLRVLRMREGDPLVVFDSRGASREGRVAGTAGGRARIEFTGPLREEPASPEGRRSRLHVAVSPLKRLAMEWMIEKLCELDAASLQPVVCARSVVRPSREEEGEIPERWERIALEAAKQSGRNAPLAFEPPLALRDWLARERPPTLQCFAHAGPGSAPLGEWLASRAGMGLPVLAAVGPEGGFAPEEVEAFRAAGFSAVSLGPLILRAETAALTVAAACRVML